VSVGHFCARRWTLAVAPDVSVPITATWSGAVFTISSPVSLRALGARVALERS
jgi:hypothetical protein